MLLPVFSMFLVGSPTALPTAVHCLFSNTHWSPQDRSHPFHQRQVHLWCHQEIRTPRSIHAQPETNSHQFCLALLWPHLLHSLLLKTLCVPSEVMVHPQSEKWKCQSISCVRLFVTLWTVACQAPLSMGSPRQEYWSELPFLPPGDLPDPGMEHRSPALQNSLKIQLLLWAFPHHFAPMGNRGCCFPCILLTWMWGRGPRFPWCCIALQPPQPLAEDFSPWITGTLCPGLPQAPGSFSWCVQYVIAQRLAHQRILHVV